MKGDLAAFVYVMMDKRRGCFKVGHSINPPNRLEQLGGRRRLELVHASKPLVAALKIEKVAHKLLQLAGKHITNELFSATLDECIEAIERAERIVAGVEPDPSPDAGSVINLVLGHEEKVMLDDLRRAEPDLPSRSEMIRRLIERAAANGRPKPKK